MIAGIMGPTSNGSCGNADIRAPALMRDFCGARPQWRPAIERLAAASHRPRWLRPGRCETSLRSQGTLRESILQDHWIGEDIGAVFGIIGTLEFLGDARGGNCSSRTIAKRSCHVPPLYATVGIDSQTPLQAVGKGVKSFSAAVPFDGT